MKALSATHKYLLKYKWHLLLGVLFVVIANLFAIVPAQLVRNTFDLVKQSIENYQHVKGTSREAEVFDGFTRQVIIYGLLMLGMAILRGIFMFFMRQTIIVMSRLIEYDQKNEIYAHYQSLSLSFYRQNNTGDLMARISEDVSKVRMYFGPAIMYGLNLVSMSVLCISIMLNINVKLTLFTLLPLPILSILVFYVNNLIEKRSTLIQTKLSEISSYVQEAFSGIRVIKAYAREKDSVDNFINESETYKQKQLDLLRINSIFTPIVMFLVGLSIIVVVYVGGQEVMKGNITAGNVAEFIMYVTMLTWPFTSLGWVSSIVQRAEASQKRINEFLNTQSELVSEKNILKEINGKISFQSVSLTYPESGIKALKNINFELESGKSIAIIGATGSGKSSLANLICRLFDATEGQILIDDINIKDFQLKKLRSQIGYVPQDVFLFSETIENNINFGIEHSTEAELQRVIEKSDLVDNIATFPDKLNTMVGERGITLSGGQKQRVSIARALIKKPKILILDDSLSAVDTKTENTILNFLEEEMKGKTTVIISHRVSSTKLADYILMLENGEVAELGLRTELLAYPSKYKELYDKQQSMLEKQL